METPFQGLGTKRNTPDDPETPFNQPETKKLQVDLSNEESPHTHSFESPHSDQPTGILVCTNVNSPNHSVVSSPFSDSYPLDPEPRDPVDPEMDVSVGDGSCVHDHFLLPTFVPIKNSNTPQNRQIIAELRRSQRQFMPKCDYMARQAEINEQMRAILVDWLVEVSDEFKLATGTLFLTVSIVDRFLDRVQIPRDKLQLVGVASMIIAAKLQKSSPGIDKFVSITDHTYTAEQITKIEAVILNDLAFKILAPTTHTFLVPFQDVGKVDEEVRHLSSYLTELCLLEYVFVKYEPSIIAASAIALARHTVDVPSWDDALEEFSGHSLSDLGDCMEDMLAVFTDSSTSQLQALREKYSAANPYLCVAHIAPPDSPPF